jgi:hypothetical protein
MVWPARCLQAGLRLLSLRLDTAARGAAGMGLGFHCHETSSSFTEPFRNVLLVVQSGCSLVYGNGAWGEIRG